MAKICPQTGGYVLYTECIECELRGKCISIAAEKSRFALLVVGSRDITDESYVFAKIDKMISQIRGKYDLLIVSGGAGGVDALAEKYADKNSMEKHIMPADWKRYGKAAGYIRNRQMHEYISHFEHRGVIIIWNGESRGTAQSFKLAEEFKNEKKVFLYKKPENKGAAKNAKSKAKEAAGPAVLAKGDRKKILTLIKEIKIQDEMSEEAKERAEKNHGKVIPKSRSVRRGYV